MAESQPFSCTETTFDPQHMLVRNVVQGVPTAPLVLGRNIPVNGKFYPAVDGAFIPGPQWAHYMHGVVGLYNHGNF